MKPALRNQKGQMVIEMILILVTLFGLTFMVSRYFKNEEVLKRLISGPWQSLAGMLQNGVWGPPAATAISHPNSHIRHINTEGDRVQ